MLYILKKITPMNNIEVIKLVFFLLKKALFLKYIFFDNLNYSNFFSSIFNALLLFTSIILIQRTVLILEINF